jgi:hypothetical protein
MNDYDRVRPSYPAAVFDDLVEHRIATDHGGSVRKEFLGTLAVSRRA